MSDIAMYVPDIFDIACELLIIGGALQGNRNPCVKLTGNEVVDSTHLIMIPFKTTSSIGIGELRIFKKSFSGISRLAKKKGCCITEANALFVRIDRLSRTGKYYYDLEIHYRNIRNVIKRKLVMIAQLVISLIT